MKAWKPGLLAALCGLIFGCGGTSATSRSGRSEALSNTIVAKVRFDGSDGQGTVPDVEDLDGTESYSTDPNVWIAQCHWDFGDGTTSDDCWVEHTYTTAGQYQPTLTVTGSDGSTASAHLSVDVTGDDTGATGSSSVVAAAKFDGSNGQGTAPDVEDMDGTYSYSTDPNVWITQCHWSFGDGATSNDCWVEHTYTTPGDYQPTLTVTGSDGSTSSTHLTVTVTGAGETDGGGGSTSTGDVVAVARFDGSDGQGTVPDTEDFDGTESYSTDPNVWITGCHWDFGDGTTSNDCWAEHVYSQSGSYSATLTAYGSDGSTGTTTLGVEVNQTSQPRGSTLWTEQFGSGTENDEIVAIRVDGAGNVITLEEDHAQQNPVGVVKRAPDGVVLWRHPFMTNGLGAAFNLNPRSLAVTPGGDIYVVWNSTCAEGCPVDFGGGPTDVSEIIKIDSNGNFVWQQSPGDLALAVSTNSTGEIAVMTGSHDSPATTIREYTPDGTPLSSNTANGVERIALDEAGDVVVVGDTSSVFSEKTPFGFDVNGEYLIKLDGSLQLMWGKRLDFNVTGLATSEADTIVLTGSGTALDWAGTQYENLGSAPEEFLLTAESDGSERWARELGDFVTRDMSVSSGTASLALVDPSGAPSIVRYDLAGDPLWTSSPTCSGGFYSLSSIGAGGGNLFVGGDTGTCTTSSGSKDAVLMRLEP